MFDSIESTLSAETVNSFTRNRKKLEEELTVDEATWRLEMQVWRLPNEKLRVVPVEEGGSLLDLSSLGTPGGSGMGMGVGVSLSLSTQVPPQLVNLDFLGPPIHLSQDPEVSPEDRALKVLPPPPQFAYPTESSQQPLAVAAAGVSGGVLKHSHRHTPPANPQVPPKTPPAQARV